MPILVDPNKTFPVRVKYRDVYDALGDAVGVKILPDDTEGEDVNTFEIHAIGRCGDRLSRLMEECTYFNHVTGRPLIRQRLFQYGVFRHFFKRWNLRDPESGEELPMTEQTLMWLDWGVVRAAVRVWLDTTGGRL